MDRHPFANPAHAYDRMTSGEYVRPPDDPFANLRSFAPMASDDSFYDRTSLRPSTHYQEDVDWTVPAWKRALNRVKRSAQRGFKKLRRLLDV